MNPIELKKVREEIRKAELNEREVSDALEQSRLKHSAAEADTDSEREKFMASVATRKATAQPDQDKELIARTERVDNLQALERVALAQLEMQQKLLLDAQQASRKARLRLNELEQAAQGSYAKARQSQELRVFGYRLALTMPLLLLAGWLYKKKRQSTYWPFVWGFIYFALFAFCRTGALPTQLWWLYPLPGGHCDHAVGGAPGDSRLETLPGSTAFGRSPARNQTA